MIKRIVITLLFLSILFVFSSCQFNDSTSLGNIKSIDNKNSIVLSGLGEGIVTKKDFTANVYYRYGNYDLLVPEEHIINVKSDETQEFALLKEMSKKSLNFGFGFHRLMPNELKILSAVAIDNNKYLGVTLDSSFLIKDSSNDLSKQINDRRLALNAIVLTVTDNFPYIGVQFFVKNQDELGSLIRLNSSFNSSKTAQAMPLTLRDDKYIATPKQCAKLFLKAWKNLNIDSLEQFLHRDINYSMGDIKSYIQNSGNIQEYRVSEYTFINNGKTAIVSIIIKTESYPEEIVYPLKMQKISGLWRVDENSFTKLLDFI